MRPRTQFAAGRGRKRSALAATVLVLSMVGASSPAAAQDVEVDLGIVFSADQSCDTGSDRLVSSATPFEVAACFTESGSPVSGREVYLEVTHGDGELEVLDAVTDGSGEARFTVIPTSAGVTTATICDANGCYQSVEQESDSPPPPPVIPYTAGGGDIGSSDEITDNPLDLIDAYTGGEAGSAESSAHGGVDIHRFSYAGVGDDGRSTFKIEMVGDGRDLFDRAVSRWDISIQVGTPDDTSYSLRVAKNEDGGLNTGSWDGTGQIADADVQLEWSEDGGTACISAAGIDVPEGSSVTVFAAAALDDEGSGLYDELSGELVPGDGPPDDGDDDSSGGLGTSNDDSSDSDDTDGSSTGDDGESGGSGGSSTGDGGDSGGLPILPIVIGTAAAGGAGLWLRSKNKEEDEKPKPKVRIISNGGTDSVNQYQTFRVVVEIPRDGDERPDDEIDIELSAESWDNETLTLAWDDRQHAKAPDGPAVYVSQPITLAKGAEGEGTVTVFGHEWSVGGFEGLWFTNGETVTISFGGSSTEFIAYDSWIEQGIGRCMLVIAHWKNVWTKVLADTEGQEGPEAELARANAKRGLEWAAKAEKWNERDDALQGTKLAYIEGYASNIGDFYVDLREAFTTEQGISHRGQENAHNYKAKGISDNAYQVGSALYQTVVGATIAGSAYTLGSGDTIMGQEATWDQQVLAGVEFAGWLTVASGFDARGLGDVVGGSGAKRAATDSLGDLADEVPTGPSTRPPDTFSSGWNQPTGSGPGYFNPAGTLDTIGSPATGRQVDATKLVPNTSRKDVYIHGTRPGADTPFVSDAGTPISVNRVATIVEASDWKPGIAVRLISCFSASSGAAADLARRLKTRVLAPTHAVSINPDGSFRFHGNRKPPDPNAPNAPRGYAPPPPEAGWLEFDETGTLVGKIDQQGNWSAP